MDHMTEKKPYLLAVSRAGHDKGKIYAVCAADDEYVWLVNGTTRPLGHPKKKKRIHVQLVRHLPEEVIHFLEKADNDRHITQALECWKSRQQVSKCE